MPWKEAVAKNLPFITCFVLLLITIIACGVITYFYLNTKDKLDARTCDVAQCEATIDDQLRNRTRKLQRDLVMTGSFEFGSMTQGMGVLEYNIRVYCSWEVLAQMAKALSGETEEFDETSVVAQVVGDLSLSRTMLSCQSGLEDIKAVPDRSKFAFHVVFFTDDLVNSTFGLVKVFFDKQFLNMYTQIQTKFARGTRILGVEVGNKLQDYMIRKLMLSPVYMRMGRMENNVFKDMNDNIQKNQLVMFLQQLFVRSENNHADIMIRTRPDECPYHPGT